MKKRPFSLCQKVFKQSLPAIDRMSKGTLKRTVNRKKKRGEKKDLLLEAISNTLKSAQKPMATQEIADELEKPWHSIQTRCLKLQIEQKIIGFRVGRINLWQTNVTNIGAKA